MRAIASLGVPASAIAESSVTEADDTDNPASDVRVLAERVAARRHRWLRLAGAPTTVRGLILLTEPDKAGGRLDHALRAYLGALSAVMPGLTYASDPTMPEGTLDIRLGERPQLRPGRAELTLLTCAVPPPGTTFLWSRSAWDEPMQGYHGSVDAAAFTSGLWARVDLDSPAEEALGGARDDYLAYVTATALMIFPESLPDLEAAQTLLAALFEHIGAGHTVWFARELLTDEQLLVALRVMLRDGAAVTQFGAFLRELLVELDPAAPDSGFTAALAGAQARWRLTWASDEGAMRAQVRLPADLVEELGIATQGWDEWLPAECAGVERLRDEIQRLPTDRVLLVVPDGLRAFVVSAPRRRAGDLIVLGDRDAPLLDGPDSAPDISGGVFYVD